MVIATDATPTHWTFYFQGSGLPLLVSRYWSGSICGVHIALQELQAIATMVRRMAFCLSGKVVALHLDNSTAKADLCNHSGTVSPFLSRLACQILSLTDKHGITVIPAYIPTHLIVEADYLPWDQMLPEWHLLPQVAQAAFHLWHLPEVDPLASSSCTQCQHYYVLESPLPLGALGVECLHWMFQVQLCVSSSCISSSSSVQVSGRTCQRSVQTFDSGGTILDGGSLAPHSSNMLADIAQQCPIIKDLAMDFSVDQVLKGLPYLHLSLWLFSVVCYADGGSLLQSVRQWWGQLECLHQRSTSNVGRNGQVGVLDRVYQTVPSLLLN